MDQQLVGWVLHGIGAMLMSVLSYMYKSMADRVKSMENRLADTREQYVHKDDIKEFKVEINHRFDKLEDLIQKRNGQ